jgi:hypothetical protein
MPDSNVPTDGTIQFRAPRIAGYPEDIKVSDAEMANLGITRGALLPQAGAACYDQPVELSSNQLRRGCRVPYDEQAPRDDDPPETPRYARRRLFDKILIPFHHACDEGDFEVAEKLLRVLGMMVDRAPTNPDGDRRRNLDGLVAAHERLWTLRHPAEPHNRASWRPALQSPFGTR